MGKLRTRKCGKERGEKDKMMSFTSIQAAFKDEPL